MYYDSNYSPYIVSPPPPSHHLLSTMTWLGQQQSLRTTSVADDDVAMRGGGELWTTTRDDFYHDINWQSLTTTSVNNDVAMRGGVSYGQQRGPIFIVTATTHNIYCISHSPSHYVLTTMMWHRQRMLWQLGGWAMDNDECGRRLGNEWWWVATTGNEGGVSHGSSFINNKTWQWGQWRIWMTTWWVMTGELWTMMSVDYSYD